MNSRITVVSGIIAAVCSLALTAVIILPIWRIELSAPQYPEGLVLKIYAGRLGGNVDIVNGLNHYIGMRTLHEKDFIEFQVLPYIIGVFAFFGLVSSLIRKRWFFFTWVALFILFAGTAVIDFYRWEYNYGHNLDPSAPIRVPGMSYQPPLLGYKQLLNFGAYSVPDSGGWIFLGVGVLLSLVAWRELRRMFHNQKRTSLPVTAALVTGVLFLTGCSREPAPIQYGSDGCSFCKMTITDNRFGGEWVTSRGKMYKFDDIYCLTSFLSSNMENNENTGIVYLVNFSHPGTFVPAKGSFLFTSPGLRSPMGGNTVAVASEEDIKKIEKEFSGHRLHWEDVTHK